MGRRRLGRKGSRTMIPVEECWEVRLSSSRWGCCSESNGFRVEKIYGRGQVEELIESLSSADVDEEGEDEAVAALISHHVSQANAANALSSYGKL